ncbi:MAG: YdeI/OmpD-associated family protein [Sphingomonadaceae bacterium]|nr:YdeI/OmpD-associated family protein [Sphingomonadaceae bacterium]
MTDRNIDTYIAEAQPFAVPILQTLRARVHAALPDVDEDMKWGMPTFVYKGKIVCNMAAFKRHATFGFWHGEMVTGGTGARMAAMGDLGRITSVDQLPDEKTIAAWIAKAKRLIEDGVKPPHVEGRGKHPKPELDMIPAFQAALDGNMAAKTTYEGFPPSSRREYLEWIIDAKRTETRHKRIAQAIEWLAAGKRRNWKYENC